MKITGEQSYLQVGTGPKGTREIQGVEENRKGIAAASQGGDKVVLSPQARQLQEAREMYDALPDIRSEKVSDLKKQIMDGTYEMNSGRVAWKMIQESLMVGRS